MMRERNTNTFSTSGLAGREDLYEVLRPIGSGSFGQVFLVVHRLERRQYVMKSIELKSTTLEGREAAELEVRLLSAVRHPHIVTYRESFVNNAGHLCIFMEYCEHGDVFTYLQEAKKAGKVPDEGGLLQWFIQISLALHALHLKKILHRDLKTQNIFLTGNRSQSIFALKLGDFGIATVLNSTHELAKTQIGTPFYMSPELINNKPYSYKSDVWGLGCVLYEIINGQRAFDAQGLNGLALKIIKGNYTPITSACSPGTRSLIKSMLNRNPKNRPTLKEILHLSSIRPRILHAHRNAVNAGPQESRVGIEQALNNQLSTLGLGGLVNCPGAGPKRDRGRTLQLLEKAKLRKKREEEELHRTAALLAQCLGELPPSPPSPQGELQSAGPPRDAEQRHSHYGSLELSQDQPWVETPREDSQEDTMMPAMSHRDRILMDKERRREEAQRREEMELRKIREANLAQQAGFAHQRERERARVGERKGSKSVPGRERASSGVGGLASPCETCGAGGSAAVCSSASHERPAPHERRRRSPPIRSRAHSKEVVGPGDGYFDNSNMEPWHPDPSRRGNAMPSPRRRGRRTTSDPSPPPALYGEPMPPHQAPRNGGAHVSWRSSDVNFRGAPPARQPMHSVCLEALDAPERGGGASDRERVSFNWCSEDSYSSGSLSEVDEWEASSVTGWSHDNPKRQRNLQQRIDSCRAAICRHKMTIAMLQYSAAHTQEQEGEAEAERPRLESLYPGSGDEGGSSVGLPPMAPHALLANSHWPLGGAAPGTPAFVQDFAARLQRRCLEGLGLEKFRAARRCLRALLDAAEVPGAVRSQMLELLGIDKIGFLSLLDQLVHMERRWGSQDAL